jgi:hypothetical protein
MKLAPLTSQETLVGDILCERVLKHVLNFRLSRELPNQVAALQVTEISIEGRTVLSNRE